MRFSIGKASAGSSWYFFLLGSLLGLILKHKYTECHILRANCMNEGKFTLTFPGKSLRGASISALSGVSEDGCHAECLLNRQCKSVNYHSMSQACQLNSKIVGDIDTSLQSKSGWKHQSTNYSSNLFGPMCREVNPCHPNQRCVGICECPGYACYNCDEEHEGIRCDEKVVNMTIINLAGKCIGWSNVTENIVVSPSCDLFIITETNRIKHVATRKCIKAENLNHNAELILTSNCEELDTVFQYTKDFNFKHALTDKCVHVLGGSLNPSIGQHYVIHSGCDEIKLQFVMNFTESNLNASSCLEIKQLKPNTRSGIYKVRIPNNRPVEMFCDMDTDNGGWTLVWSYTFTRPGLFQDPYNAVTPIPNWPSSNTNVPRSTTPPAKEYSSGALDFNLWKLIGKQFLIKSNINHWLSCSPGTGSLVDWKVGNIQCNNIKNIAPDASCQNTAPDQFSTSNPSGPILQTSGSSMFYYFDGDTNGNWPIHDPCSSNQAKQKNGVVSAGGQIYVR